MNAELIRIVDDIARSRKMDRERVFNHIEHAFASALEQHHDGLRELGDEMLSQVSAQPNASTTFQVSLDRITGDIRAFQVQPGGATQELPRSFVGGIGSEVVKQVLIRLIQADERRCRCQKLRDKISTTGWVELWIHLLEHSAPGLAVRETRAEVLADEAGLSMEEIPLALELLETIGAVEWLSEDEISALSQGQLVRGALLMFSIGEDCRFVRLESPDSVRTQLLARKQLLSGQLQLLVSNEHLRIVDDEDELVRSELLIISAALAAIESILSQRAATEVQEPGRESIPASVRREVWRRDQGRCVECGSQERLEFDHIIPYSKGGSSTARNIRLLCEACNREKSDEI